MPQSPVGFTPPNPGPISTPTSPMPPQRPTTPTPEPEQITAPPAPPTPPSAESNTPPTPMAPQKKKSHLKTIIGVIILVLTVAGAAAGFFLSQNSQDVRQQASSGNNCCDDQGWVGMGRSCGDEGAPTYQDGWNACQAHACGICEDTPVRQCDPECASGVEGCIEKNGVKQWCGNDCYLRSPSESCANSTWACCGGTNANYVPVPTGTPMCGAGLYCDGSKPNLAGANLCDQGQPYGGIYCCPSGQIDINGSCQAPGTCSIISECKTYDCPNGMDTNNGQECTLTSPTTVPGVACSPPASNCGQVDYYSTAGDFNSYCGHVIYDDGCPNGGTPGDTPGGGGGGGVCQSLVMSNPTPTVGETVTLTCAGSNNPTGYTFNVNRNGVSVAGALKTVSGAPNQRTLDILSGEYTMSCDVTY
ncbi:MAG: hypothetical protein GW945_01610 [Candidatus Pacebacteria bacterium]|nr:hypothetical protein [Candidatus Paceibacterota bacterium]